jgi:hypothetical protein
MPEERLRRAADRVVVHGPRGTEDHLTGPVMLAHEGPQVPLAEGAHPLDLAQDRPPQGLVGIRRLLEPVEDDVVGVSSVWPISCRITPRSTSISSSAKTGLRRMSGDHVESEVHVVLRTRA